MQRHLLLAGAGHCHLEVLGNLEEYLRRGCKVTLISPGNFWYSGMGPGALSRMYPPETVCVDTAALVREGGGKYVEDTVRRIDVRQKTVELGSGTTISYDLLSLNVGSLVPTSMIEGAESFGWTVKPIENLVRLREAIEKRTGSHREVRVVIAGGGAAGCEIAINIRRLLEQLATPHRITLVHSGEALMKREGKQPGRKVARAMERAGVRVAYRTKVVRAEPGRVHLDDGSSAHCDFFIIAVGVQPPPLFRESDLPTAADGSLLVNEHLQCVSAPDIFGAGDCVGFACSPPPRVGVYAVRESKLLHHNLLAWLDGSRLRRFRPGKSYMLILNLGDGDGLLFWNGRAWRGRWAFRLKNFLDCRFVEKYRSD